jgi:hypothetical protein
MDLNPHVIVQEVEELILTGQPHSMLASICKSGSDNNRETEASSSLLMSISFSGIKSRILLPLAIIA